MDCGRGWQCTYGCWSAGGAAGAGRAAAVPSAAPSATVNCAVVGIPGADEIALRPPPGVPEGVVTASTDLTNAFNVGDRNLILTMVANLQPELEICPITRLLYRRASALLARQLDGDNTAMWSRADVRQGDPLGPLMFALSFLPTSQRAQESAPESVAVAAHDDTGRPTYRVMRNLPSRLPSRCFRAKTATATGRRSSLAQTWTRPAALLRA